MAMHTTTQILDTIIIGAGWSGAVAARDLASKGFSVLVLEARDRVGGRAKTHNGIDVGCSWIHGYKEGNPARGIAEGLGIPAQLPKPAEGVIYEQNRMPSTDAAALRSSLSTAQASLKLPYPAPPPTASLAALLTGVSPSFAGFARSLEVPLGLTLEQASLRWSGWETTTSYAGSDAAPEGGYENLVSRVLDEAATHGTKLKLSTPIAHIQQGNDIVAVSTSTGDRWFAKTAICTVPLGVMKTWPTDAFDPPLPRHMQDTIKGTHVGVLEKLLVQYPSAWWPEAQTASSYTFLPTTTSMATPQDIFSSSTIIVANFAGPTLPNPTPTLLTYLSETPAKALLKHDPATVTAAFHDFLTSRFRPTTRPPAPTTSSLTNWLTDPYSLGASTTPSIISNGERSPMDFKELGRPVWYGRLGFAGEHTEMEHRGSVAGAVISGMREAARVDRFLKRD